MQVSDIQSFVISCFSFSSQKCEAIREISLILPYFGPIGSLLHRIFFFSLNANVQVKLYQVLFNSSNAKEIIDDYDIVADCSDNAPTRCCEFI